MGNDGVGLSRETAVLATMHQKERAIAPVFAQELGMTVTVVPQFDTDRFGTFTRDVPRLGTQIETARLKAQAALEMTGEAVAIASEGAFFPHPALPLLPCDREIVLLVDQINAIEIVGQVLSTTTNYRHATIRSLDDALTFAQEIGFPEHGLVVMPAAEGSTADAIVKGIATEAELVTAIETTLRTSPTRTVHLETDMRALYNPTRMDVIAQATRDLVLKIRQRCPECGCPGFDVVEQIPGLPCGLCRLPTEMIRLAVQRCQRCGHVHEVMFPNGITEADPAHCWSCNP